VLTGKQFFPELISGPFHSGLVVVFAAAALMMVIGAAASWVNPGRAATTISIDNVKPPNQGARRIPVLADCGGVDDGVPDVQRVLPKAALPL
jgi:hypothetical protein